MNMNVSTVEDIQLKPITFCKYHLKIAEKDMLLTFPQILDLRSRINKLSDHETLEELIDSDNFVLLFIADRQHLVYLDIPMLMSLRIELEVLFHNSNPVLI